MTPARKVNPRVRFILKYPCWYDEYYSRGYDVIRESDFFDGVWVGTETRDPDCSAAGSIPQTQASFLMGWMNCIAPEKCGGGWYDPLGTSPAVFVEQARETSLGGARESLLHCFDYLASSRKGIAVFNGDTDVRNGFLDAQAFLHEVSGLQ